jgi:hypothetical protein
MCGIRYLASGLTEWDDRCGADTGILLGMGLRPSTPPPRRDYL